MNAPTLTLVGAHRPDYDYHPFFLDDATGATVMHTLVNETPWRDDTISMFGRTYPVPRRTALFGDPDATYSYSNISLRPLPWTPELTRLREAVEELGSASFNCVLLNLYRSGLDSNGWHADDERELGPQPIIASLSLGAIREMQFRRRDGTARFSLALTSGSLLIMHGDAQSDWLHCIPKRRSVNEPRLNLTFRFVDHAT